MKAERIPVPSPIPVRFLNSYPPYIIPRFVIPCHVRPRLRHSVPLHFTFHLFSDPKGSLFKISFSSQYFLSITTFTKTYEVLPQGYFNCTVLYCEFFILAGVPPYSK